MAAWSVALHSRTGQEDPLWTQQIGGVTGILGKAPAHLTIRSQPLANNKSKRCISLASNPARPRKCLPWEGFSSEGCRQQEPLWRQFFLDPRIGWDNRQPKKSSQGSHDVLWLNNFYKPACVDEQLGHVDMEMGRRAHPDKHDPGRTPGYEIGVTAITVSTICQQGTLTEAVEALEALVQTDCAISKTLFYTVLKQCGAKKALVLGRRVHALTVKMGYESDTFLSNHILRMYASHGRLQEAMDVFTLVANPDTFMWYSIISAHVKHGQAKQAIQLYHQMRSSNVKPNSHVFVAALQACARGADLETGQQVHIDVLASGVEPDVFVVSGLVDMYAKCGRLKDAQSLFDGLGQKDVVTWTALIAGYSQQGMGQEALHLYSAMQEEGIAAPNSVTFVCLLKACASVGTAALEKGKQFHAQIRQQGLQADGVLGCSLVNMYAKCGSLKDAQRLFDGLGQKDVVTWTALIAGYSQQGMGQEALHLYSAMLEEGIAAPNSVTLVSLLQACATVGTPALEKGKQFHAQVRQQGLQVDVVLGSSLVNMYAKCGSLEDAQTVFDGLRQKDVAAWNALIGGYSKQGMGQEALHLHSAMQEGGITAPNFVTFVCLLKACASVGTSALERGKQLHAQIQEQGLEANAVVANSLINMYAKCGSLTDAQRFFDALGQKDVVTWTALIAGYSQQGKGQEALDLYSAMQEEGIAAPNSVTLVCSLQACASVGIRALAKGKHLHAQIQQQGLQADVGLGCSLVNMYAKCGSLENAQRVFDALLQKDVAAWNAMIGGYSQQGMGQEALHLYSAMQEGGIAAPDSVTFVCLLQACASVGIPALEKGKQLHVQIEEQGLEANVVVANSLINMYAKCGSLTDAQRLFDGLGQKDVRTWTTLIAGYSQQGLGQEALHLYSAMQEGIGEPDSVTFACLLQAYASVGTQALEKGKQLHGQIQEQGLEADVVVANSLINMYAKCGSLTDAQRLFDTLGQKDVVTWTAMIAGYSQQGMGQKALHLYSGMQEQDIAAPNSVTLVCLLQACASVGTPALEMGKQFHAQIRQQGLQADLVLGCSLINMYAKCGSLEDAQRVFDGLRQKDGPAWNAMIGGYSQQGMGQEALHLHSAMQGGITAPDFVTFVCLLQACASVGTPALERGKQLHAQIQEQGLEANVVVANSLINMYAKCGSLTDAQRLFDALGQKDVVSWTALIAGYSQQGMGQEALHLYRDMQDEGIATPNSVTFVCLLQACASVAALLPGRQLHAQIEQQGLQADVFVASSLISMYAKSGSMVDAQQVFDALPERGIVPWNALIAGYTCLGDSEVVFDLVQRMKEDGIQPDGITFLSLLTVCSRVGLVNKGQEYFEAMSRLYDITPTVDHYTCMVDLLGRAGQLDEALEVVRTMPVKPHHVVWHALLGACRKWGNVKVGRHAFDEAVKLDKKDAAAYVTMCNIYTGAQMWEEAQEIRARRIKHEAWKPPGQSWWTDLSGRVHAFLAGDKQHPESEGIYARLQQLVPRMKKEGYVPHLDSSLRGISDDEKEAHLCGHSEKLAIAYALNKTPQGTTIRIVKNLRVCDDCHLATAFISRIEKRTIICRDASRFHVYKEGKCSCGDYW